MAFDVLYQRHKSKVLQYLSKRIENQTDLEEIFQGVFLKLHKSRESFDDRYLFVQWIYTITKSQYIDFARTRKIPTVELNPEIAAPENAKNEIDLNQVPALSNVEKQAIDLRFFQDFDYDEISQKIGKSESNSRKIVSRGLAKIRKNFRRRGSV